MKRASVFAFAALLVGAPALAQDPGSIVYLPAKDSKAAQTVTLPGGRAQPVIESEGGNRPENCPKEAFWTYAGNVTGELIDCDDNSVWEIKPYEATNDTTYMFRLTPSPKPPGTDDPGSSKSKAAPEPEVNP